MSDGNSRYVSRVFDFCVGALLAAMALYGAVQIIKSIWLPLCIGALAVGAVVGIAVLLRRRFLRW